MSRSRSIRRWTAAALVAGAVGLTVSGCVAVPVGGGYGYGEPAVVFPAPSVVIAPGHGHRGHYYGHRGYGRRGGFWGHRGPWR